MKLGEISQNVQRLRDRFHTSASTKSELVYATTPYLDTSVGNAYQNLEPVLCDSHAVRCTRGRNSRRA